MSPRTGESRERKERKRELETAARFTSTFTENSTEKGSCVPAVASLCHPFLCGFKCCSDQVITERAGRRIHLPWRLSLSVKY